MLKNSKFKVFWAERTSKEKLLDRMVPEGGHPFPHSTPSLNIHFNSTPTSLNKSVQLFIHILQNFHEKKNQTSIIKLYWSWKKKFFFWKECAKRQSIIYTIKLFYKIHYSNINKIQKRNFKESSRDKFILIYSDILAIFHIIFETRKKENLIDFDMNCVLFHTNRRTV